MGKGGSVAVLAFLAELSTSGTNFPFFDSVFAYLDVISTPGTYTETGPLDFSGLISHFYSREVYAYLGSLTTPPCTQNVPWFISAEPLPLNVQTYNDVKKVLKFNSRYTQNNLGNINLLSLAAPNICG
jgi:carbonic anhydrase